MKYIMISLLNELSPNGSYNVLRSVNYAIPDSDHAETVFDFLDLACKINKLACETESSRKARELSK